METGAEKGEVKKQEANRGTHQHQSLGPTEPDPDLLLRFTMRQRSAWEDSTVLVLVTKPGPLS